MNLNKFLKSLFGDKSTRDMKLIQPLVEQVKATYPTIQALSNDLLGYNCMFRHYMYTHLDIEHIPMYPQVKIVQIDTYMYLFQTQHVNHYQ